MNTLLTTALLLALTTAAVAQGPLNPPGAPAATMKTLDQIDAKLETRTIITTSPVTILAPGSYILGRNITVPNLTAILIATDDVTLDLNGFTVSSTALPQSGHGILISGTRRNIHIKNGTIKGATGLIAGNFSGGGFVNGIFSDSAQSSNIIVSDMRVRAVADFGINLGSNATPGLVVERSSVSVCVNTGIFAHSVRASDATDCGATGISANVVSDSTGISLYSSGGAYGILAETNVTNCRGQGNGGVGIRGMNVHNSTATSNQDTAIDATNVMNSTGTSSGTSQNHRGIRASNSVTGSNGTGAGGPGIEAVTVMNCTGKSTSNHGIEADTVSNSIGSSTGSVGGDGIIAKNVTNCVGETGGSSSLGRSIRASGTASFCRGSKLGGGVAISAPIAIGCTVDVNGTVSSPSKHLGTP